MSVSRKEIESNVRSYCRCYPSVFDTAQGAYVTNKSGVRYLDFLTGCGSLNYGHNEESMKAALIEYITNDGITHSLDIRTNAKQQFFECI